MPLSKIQEIEEKWSDWIEDLDWKQSWWHVLMDGLRCGRKEKLRMTFCFAVVCCEQPENEFVTYWDGETEM